jgi:50S ribosomal protein L16 3-hydroxylase
LTKAVNPLGELSQDVFLRDYWQKKPLVIRQAFPGFESPITAEELAGLSCEAGVDSRIVIEKGGEHPWQAIYGPMDDDIFAKLPETHWTLLVNDVEKHIPALAWIVDRFRFVPEWRIDDLMVSYAPEGGSVGPHYDQYDTFILQAQGQRRWQVHSREVTDDNQVAGTGLRIQKDFVAEHEWLLEPGDMIYLPPGVSHYGVATDDCLSFSIGFRAATHAEMLESFAGFIGDRLAADLTWRDPPLAVQPHANEITPATMDAARAVLDQYLQADNPFVPGWFGRFISDTKADIVAENEDRFDDLAGLTAAHATLYRNPASRFAFWRGEKDALLFVDGDEFRVSLSFAESLCTQRAFNTESLSGPMSGDEAALLLALYHGGKLIPVP